VAALNNARLGPEGSSRFQAQITIPVESRADFAYCRDPKIVQVAYENANQPGRHWRMLNPRSEWQIDYDDSAADADDEWPFYPEQNIDPIPLGAPLAGEFRVLRWSDSPGPNSPLNVYGGATMWRQDFWSCLVCMPTESDPCPKVLGCLNWAHLWTKTNDARLANWDVIRTINGAFPQNNRTMPGPNGQNIVAPHRLWRFTDGPEGRALQDPGPEVLGLVIEAVMLWDSGMGPS
jgi:hypothetical protein